MSWDNTEGAVVIGVFECPSNTHLDVDLVVFSAWEAELDAGRQWRGGRVGNYYILLAPGASPETFGTDLLAAAERNGPEWLPAFLTRGSGCYRTWERCLELSLRLLRTSEGSYITKPDDA